MKNTEKKAIDMEFLRSVTGEDIEFEKELFVLFIDSAKNNIGKMEKALASSDENGWYMSAHAFKGASASIGAFNLSKALEYAQNHPKDNSKDKTKVLDSIKKEFEEVASFINNEFLKDQ
jgi:HPt (histidine-containing phosphotransfer) domain-containing protein